MHFIFGDFPQPGLFLARRDFKSHNSVQLVCLNKLCVCSLLLERAWRKGAGSSQLWPWEGRSFLQKSCISSPHPSKKLWGTSLKHATVLLWCLSTSCCFFKIAQGRKNPVSQRASWSQKAWPLEKKCTGLAPATARHTPVSGPLPLLYLLVGKGIFEMTMWPAPSFIFNALFRSEFFTKHIHSLVPWSDFFFLKSAHHQVNERLHLLLHGSGLLSHILTVTMPRGQKYGRSLTESWAFPVTSTCQSGSCFTEPIQPQGST